MQTSIPMRLTIFQNSKLILALSKKSHFQIRSNFSFRPANKDEIIVLIMKDLKIITPLVEKFLSTFKNLN